MYDRSCGACRSADALFPKWVQQSRRHHENSASRQLHLTRAIKETYTHRWEIGGGGGFLRFEPGPLLRRDNQIDWAVSGAYYVTPAYGIVAEVSGHDGDVKLNNATCSTVGERDVCGPSIGLASAGTT